MSGLLYLVRDFVREEVLSSVNVLKRKYEIDSISVSYRN